MTTDVSLLDLGTATVVANSDLLLVVRDPTGSPNTETISVNSFIVSVANAHIIRSQTPANSTITIQMGMMLYDNSYLYIATSDNILKRVSLSSF